MAGLAWSYAQAQRPSSCCELLLLPQALGHEPDGWLKALNVDRNPLAVTLEACLDEAMIDVLPHHILEALTDRTIVARSYPETSTATE